MAFHNVVSDKLHKSNLQKFKSHKLIKKYRSIKDLNLKHTASACIRKYNLFFHGRMEFGQRVLGHRYLSDPSVIDQVQKINETIKMRDFWMPLHFNFKWRFQKIHNKQENISSDYMTVSY